MNTGAMLTSLLLLMVVVSMANAQDDNAAPDWRAFAPTPPMGWNSWDCFGTSVNEDEVKANADYIAEHLVGHGWQYLVVDGRWYVDNPWERPYNQRDPIFIYDEFGRLMPSPARFPSSADGVGFKALADYCHQRGLKLGLHFMRGVNKEVWEKNLPIEGTDWTVQDMTRIPGDQGATWLRDNYGVERDEVSQAYFDSIYRLLAEWGVDYVKVDDMLRDYAHPEDSYYTDAIEMVRTAIDRSGRPMVLSLSPGGAPLNQAEHLQQNANLWRITDDFWDRWDALYPMFERADEWTPYRRPGNWPDNDMLPLGRLAIRGERGDPGRMSNFTRDEQLTVMTLWAISRSPLMFGGNLPDNDQWTLDLITNADVLAVNQHSTNNRQLSREEDRIIWIADAPDSDDKYLALFNAADTEQDVGIALNDLGLERATLIDLWTGQPVGEFTRNYSIPLPPHGAALYRVTNSQPQ